MIADLPRRKMHLQTMVLLSPEMMKNDTYAARCAELNYTILFNTPSASLTINYENNTDHNLLWGISGLLGILEEATAYITLPPTARRIVIVAEIQPGDRVLLRSLTLRLGDCNVSTMYDAGMCIGYNAGCSVREV